MSFGVSLVSLAFCATALAGSASGVSPMPPASSAQLQQAQKLIGTVTDHRVRVVKALQGPDGMVALEGVAVGPGHPKGKAFAWMTPNGKGLIPVAAPLVGIHKTNWTERALMSLGMEQKPVPAKTVADWIAKRARTFLLGTKGPIVDTFLDPNCIFCHKFYEAAMPLVRKGDLRLRVTLVGFLKPSSADKAAAILLAKSPAKALAYNEAHFRVAVEEGGIRPIRHPHPAITGVVGANTGILSHTGALATPTIVYCKKPGDFVMSHGLDNYSAHYLRKLFHGIGSIDAVGGCTG